MIDIEDLFNQKVSPYFNSFIKVTLNPKEMQFIINTAEALVAAKSNETSHKRDGISEFKRFVNGLKGEGAVSKYLKMDIIDPSVGISIDYDKPDVPGYNVGIKTVEYKHFPVIPKTNIYPQIICMCNPVVDNVVYICGLADVDILNKFQHEDLIIDPNLKAKGTKTGFYGFSGLKEVTIDNLVPYKIGTPIATIGKEETINGGEETK